MNIVIAMPTYNEAENIGRMINVLTKDIFPKIKNHKMMLLVIDDKSPDGTGEIVKKHKEVFLLEGNKEGLGMAYGRGFKYAIDNLKADAVMEMDADFQHDPFDVPRFIKAFDDGADYVIGSRYIDKGSIPREWSLDRKFLSVVGNLIYKVSLLMFDIHDFTTGYRLARVNYLNKINFDKVFLKSFAYKTLLLSAMKKLGAKVVEIPITFSLRETGDSKMTTNTFIDSLKVIVLVWKERLLS